MILPGDSGADTGKIARQQEEIIKAIVNKLQKFSDFAANYLAKKIHQNSLAQKSSKRLSIIVNGKKIFQSDITQEPQTYSISPENFQRIKNALNNPYKNLDEIQVKLGKETLFYAHKNQLVIDKLNLSQAPKPEQDLSLEQKLEQLTKLVSQQQEKIELLEKKLEQKLDFIIQNADKLKNKKLNNWLSNVGNKLSATWENVKTTIKNLVNSEIQKRGEQVANLSASFLEKPINFMLNRFGMEEKPGILTFHGQAYSFNKNISSGEISIFSKNKPTNILEKGNFTPQASPEDIKILRTLPEKVKNTITRNQNQKQKRNLRPSP